MVTLPLPYAPIGVIDLIADRVAADPAACAIEDGDVRMAYAELWSVAGAVADRLRGAGIGAEMIVAVGLPRGADQIVAALGVLMAGAAYVPIDPGLPLARRRFLLDDAAPAWVIDDLPAADPPAGPPVASAPAGTDLAYVIYTSGSTGTPKGVAVEHRALSNLVAWHIRTFGVTGADRVCITAGIGFDAAVWETWANLAAGATLVIPDDDVRRDPRRLRDFVVDRGVTRMFAATPMAHELCALPWPDDGSLSTLHTGGDALNAGPYATLPFTVVNNYGPTEATVIATSGTVGVDGGVPPIGRPIDGVTIRVLDPDGVSAATGELHIGGAGLARGYLRQPALTEARFRTDPSGERWYRTGDLVRIRPDGDLDFLGRIDDQVQIRGHRVEPSEVEAVLATHPGVRAAAVITDTGGTTARLRAFYTGEAGADEIRAWLRDRLPTYLVPADIQPVVVLPLTPNGKIDRAALRDVAPDRRAVTPGRTPLEASLAGMWSEVLARDVGIDESFDALGGDSLQAVRIVNRITAAYGVDVPVALFFAPLTIADLAAHPLFAERSPENASSIVTPTGGEDAPATAAQARYWFVDEFLDDPTVYNVGSVFAIDGDLDAGTLAETLSALVRRHAALRTAVVSTPVGPRQQLVRVDGLGAVELTVLGPDQDPETAFREAARRRFDLAKPPLVRAVAVRTGERAWRLCLIAHHIAIDAASIDVLIRDIGEIYSGIVAGLPVAEKALPTFADVAAWETDDRSAALRAYWVERLAGAPVLLDLPTDLPRPPEPSLRGATITGPMPEELLVRIDALARRHQASRFITILTALFAVLARHSGQSDIVIGTPVANRSRPEFEEMVGCFVNTLALRADTAGNPTFADLMGAVRETALSAYAHQSLPFDTVVEALGQPRPRAHHPLFTVMLAVQQTDLETAKLGADTLLSHAGELHTDAAHFDLTIAVEPRDGTTALSVRYATDLFEPATVRRIADHLLRVLDAATIDAGRPISDLLGIDDAERAQVLAWGRGPEPGTDVTIPAYRHVEARAAERPDHTAVICGAVQMTYAQVNAAANRLARALIAHGVGTGVPVAVVLPRSPGSVIAMLAVAKAGGVYVPLDDGYPDEVKRVRLHDVRPAVAITRDPAHLTSLCPPEVIPHTLAPEQAGRDTDLAGTPGPDDLAYTIFTSGSTGTPKGIAVHHAGLANVVNAKIDLFDVRQDSRVLQFVSFGFGVSITDVYMTLAGGATLVMRGPGALSSTDLVALVDEHAVTNLVLPASALAAIPVPGPTEPDRTAPAVAMPTVRSIAVGGETCSSALVNRWAPGRRFVNAYGPSEAAVATATAVCRAGDGVPPIGHPIPGARVYLLDDDLQPVAPGIAGEIYVGGVGVTAGYLHRPDLTRERFLDDPFAGTGRMYRTGDRARFRADGRITLLGRIDDQVNLRGVRIELGEVETVLSAHPDVAEAVAAVQQHPVAGERLVVFLVAAGPIDAAALRVFMADRLPEHFVPAMFVPMTALPRTTTGKLDRRALPIAGAGEAPVTRAPEGPAEEILADIWTAALDPDTVFGADDDFFTHGGQSILAAAVMAEIRARFEVDLPVRTLFEAPTIAGLARRVEQAILVQLTEELV